MVIKPGGDYCYTDATTNSEPQERRKVNFVPGLIQLSRMGRPRFCLFGCPS